MRIGLNLLYLLPGIVGGTETYATSLIRALAEIDPVNQYVLFLNRKSACLELTDHPNFRRVVCKVPAHYRPLRYFCEQAILPWQAIHWQLDVLHSLGYVCPLLLPCSSVVTIHDLNFRYIGDTFSTLRRWTLEFFVPRSARVADIVLTLSRTGKEQIVTKIGIPQHKILVTHLAVDSRTAQVDDIVAWNDLVRRYSLRKPYVLALSGQSRHKNLDGLLSAFSILQKRLGQACPQLVIAGHLPASVLKLDGLGNKELIFTGFVPRDVLNKLYAGADLYVFPSLYEGFGIPVLEAMHNNVPVVCSRLMSLLEVTGDAAVYFNPYSPEDMANKIIMVLQDTDLQCQLVKRGHNNLKRFSWKDTARKTLKAYTEAVRLHQTSH